MKLPDIEHRYNVHMISDESIYGRWSWWYRFCMKHLCGFTFVLNKDGDDEQRARAGLPPRDASPEPGATSYTDANP